MEKFIFLTPEITRNNSEILIVTHILQLPMGKENKN